MFKIAVEMYAINAILREPNLKNFIHAVNIIQYITSEIIQFLLKKNQQSNKIEPNTNPITSIILIPKFIGPFIILIPFRNIGTLIQYKNSLTQTIVPKMPQKNDKISHKYNII